MRIKEIRERRSDGDRDHRRGERREGAGRLERSRGHAVTISSPDPEDASIAAKETGARAESSNAAAVEGASVVVLAVPYTAVDGILDELGDALAGKTVVDVTNALKPDGSGLLLEGTSAAEAIQARVASARVVKAFNTVFASGQAQPVVDGIQLDAFVAGDDAEAKAAVLELASSIGFRPIDAGPLSMARVPRPWDGSTSRCRCATAGPGRRVGSSSAQWSRAPEPSRLRAETSRRHDLLERRDNRRMGGRRKRAKEPDRLAPYRRIRKPMPPPERVVPDKRRKIEEEEAERQIRGESKP